MARTRFVGRGDELEALRRIAAAIEHDRGPVAAVILGEPGMGKTRLLGELVAPPQVARVLRLTGFEPERQVPLAAAADLLRALSRAPVHGQRLRALLHGDPSAGGALQPLQLFEAAHAALAEIAPVLVAVDDLQWADDMSVALCHYLFRAAAAESTPAGLLCATRPGPHADAFVKALDGLAVADGVPVLTLGALDDAAALALTAEIAPNLSPADARALCRLAAGSPFWIEALARGDGRPARGDAPLGEQLRNVGPDPADCLAALTVAARPLREPDLAVILDWDPARVDAALTALGNRGLVTPDGASVRISHDLVREAAGRQIVDAERRRLRLRLAAWLSAEDDADLQQLMEGLEHAYAAGRTPADLALRIARHPQRRLLGGDGVRRMAQICDAVSATDADHLHLDVAVARLAGEIGDRTLALERWTALADRLPTPPERAWAALDAARHAVDLKRSGEAAQLLDRARTLAGADPWVGVEADALEHARRAWVDNDMARAAQALQRAITRARQLVGEKPTALDGLDSRARRAYLEVLTAERDDALVRDDLPRLIRISEERVAATHTLGEDHLVAQADAATCLWYLNRFEEAATRLGRVLDEARAQSRPALTAEICHILAFTRYHLGGLQAAQALLEEAQRLEARTAAPTRRTVPWVRGGLRHLVRASTEDWQDGVRGLRQEVASTPDPHGRVRLRLWTGLCLSRYGGPDRRTEVVAEVAAIDADRAEAGCLRCGWEAHLATVEYLARAGEREQARERLAAWDEHHPSPEPRAALTRTRAAALVTGTDDLEGVAARLRRLVQEAHRSGLRLDEFWALVDLAELYAGADEAASVEWLTAAHALATSIGARTEADLAQRRLRALGVRRRTGDRPPAPDGPPLTPRELDVARLVASGARNTDIAAALFVSPKTVERHLSNAFAKLGVRNRAELVSRYPGAIAEGATGTPAE